jgi:hypothetical protein
MERTKNNKKVSAILCSDFHLREDTPTCFTGDFQIEQWGAVDCISDLQEKYDCLVFHAGDLFHHWKASPWLLSMAMEHLPKKFHSIYGQHDLPQHSWELKNKSGLHALAVAGKVKILDGTHWGQEPLGIVLPVDGRLKDAKEILVCHHMTYLSKPFPGAEGGMAEGILRKYPQFSLICTGDNHCSFDIEYKGRRLVNPGNITRQTADQIDFKPRVALWYAEDNSIQWVYLPIQEGVISREHIDIKEQRDARIDAFVSKLNDDYVTELSFEQNLENFFNANNTREPIKEIIYKSLE